MENWGEREQRQPRPGPSQGVREGSLPERAGSELEES